MLLSGEPDGCMEQFLKQNLREQAPKAAPTWRNREKHGN